MKNGVLKAKYVIPIQEKLSKFCLQVMTDARFKIAVLEICSEKNTRESAVGTFKIMCTVAVYCWYMKDVFAGFCQQIFKKNSEDFLGKVDKNVCHT